MKYYIDAVLIVEGKSDEAFLTNYFDVDIIKTNGLDIKKEDIEFLKFLVERRKVIVLTDSDQEGKNIRKKLNDNVVGLFNIEVNIDRCNKNGKHGVAECDIDEIIKVLKPWILKEKSVKNPIKIVDLYKIGLLGNEGENTFYNNVIKKLHLGDCNNKKLVKKLNMLNMSIEELYDYK